MACDSLQQGRPPGKRILLISYHFPPSAAIGGLRMANYARCLPDEGWDPQILTIRDRDIDSRDQARLEGLAGLRIYKAAVLPTLLGLFTTVTRTLARVIRGGRPEMASKQSSASTEERRETLIRRLFRWILSFLTLPDGNRGWILPATYRAVIEIRKQRIDWIATSCPPYSTHLVGLVVKLLTGTQWVADFRDPWMTAEFKQLYPTSALSLRIDTWMERRIIEKSDLLVFNVLRLRDAYRDRYSRERPEKFLYIPNGIPAVAVGPTADKYAIFTLTYAGSLYAGRSPEPIFKALSQLIDSGAVASAAVRIKLVGRCSHVNGTPLSSLVIKYGLEAVVEVHDTVPQTTVWQILYRSHLAILLAPGLPFQIPGKVYDYLGVGTRILAIAEQGATADLIRETGRGRAFAPSDIEGIATFIRDELKAPPEPTKQVDVLPQFDVRRLTKQFVDAMNHFDGLDEKAGRSHEFGRGNVGVD